MSIIIRAVQNFFDIIIEPHDRSLTNYMLLGIILKLIKVIYIEAILKIMSRERYSAKCNKKTNRRYDEQLYNFINNIYEMK